MVCYQRGYPVREITFTPREADGRSAQGDFSAGGAEPGQLPSGEALPPRTRGEGSGREEGSYPTARGDKEEGGSGLQDGPLQQGAEQGWPGICVDHLLVH